MADSEEHRGWIGRLLGGRRTRAERGAPPAPPTDEDRTAWARPWELVDLSTLPPRLAEEMVEVAAAIEAADQARDFGERAEAERLLRGAVTTTIDPYRQLAEQRLGGLLAEDGRIAEGIAVWLRAVEGPDPSLRRSVAISLGAYAFTDGPFLVNADPATLLPLLPHADWGFPRVGAAVYEASAHRHRGASAAVRRELLALDAARYGDRELLARIEAAPVPGEPGPRRHVQWASGAQLGGCRWSVAGHEEGTSALTTTTVDGRAVVVTGGDDGAVRLWDLATGEPVGEPMTGHTGQVCAVAATRLNGRPVAVSAGRDMTVRIWDLAARRPLHPPLTGHTNWVTGAATATLRGRPVAVTCGDDQTVRVWDLATGEAVGTPMQEPPRTAHFFHSRLKTLATAVIRRRPVAVTGDMGGTLRVWDLAKGREFLPPLPLGFGGPELAVVTVDGRPAAAVGVWGAATLWDLAAGRRLGERMLLGRDVQLEVAATTAGGAPVVCTGDHSGMVRLWDPATGQQLSQAFAPLGGTRALAATTVDGRPVVLIGTGDGRVHRWDPATDGRPVGKPTPGHGDAVTAVTTVEVDGTTLVASAGWDGTARLWDLATGEAAGTLAVNPREPVRTMATAVVDGRPVLLTAGGEPLARRWDPATGGPSGAPLAHDGEAGDVDAVATTVLDGRAVAVAGGANGLVRVWDLATGEVLHQPPAGHESDVCAVATAVVDGRPVAVTADESTVRVWDLTSGAPLGGPFGFPPDEPAGEPADAVPDDADEDDELDDDEDEDDDGPCIELLAAAVVDGRPLVAVGRDDGLVQVWDLAARTPLGPPFPAADDGLTAMTVAPVDGRPALVTGGHDGTVRTWDLTTLAQLGPDLVLPLPVGALAPAPAGRLVVGFGWEVAVFGPAESAAPAGSADAPA
ncbi:WD40 repeat domain-containing protein [Kitasatospora sp. NPDC056531]|uniref:WD40 repeat domain-containing protein n=1 Tax=Kitasatospora sp. NPDC056531 TaxID=3345856 RepID=UPI0036AD5126